MFPCRTHKGVVNVHPDDTFCAQILCFRGISIQYSRSKCNGGVAATYFASHLAFVTPDVKDACSVKESRR